MHATNINTWYDQKKQTSIMYSKTRSKWIEGPNIPVGLKFVNACGLSLNRSKVLFVGVSLMPFADTLNNITLTYDFSKRKWEYQEYLPISMNTVGVGVGMYYTSCAKYFDKDVEKAM